MDTAQTVLALPWEDRTSEDGVLDLPGYPIVFASGSNHAGEIRGFASLGIPVGVAADQVRADAVAELEALESTDAPVFVDSGAFGEVSANPARHREAGLEPEPGVLKAVNPIPDAEWQARLDLYERLAHILGDQLYAVVPDRVGCQVETLARIRRYAPSIRRIATLGARLLVPLQQGEASPTSFYKVAQRAAGCDLVPAFPMKKAGTPVADVVQFCRAVRPPRLHLLGLGGKNRRAREILTLIRRASPGTRVSMDANLITAAVGRQGPRPRRLTAAQDEWRDKALETAFCETSAPEWDVHLDWTEYAPFPSEWLRDSWKRRIAKAVGLTGDDRRSFLSDPDHFLEQPVHPDSVDGTCWYEHPVLSLEIERAWLRHLDTAQVARRKCESILAAFDDHLVSDQFSAPPPAGVR